MPSRPLLVQLLLLAPRVLRGLGARLDDMELEDTSHQVSLCQNRSHYRVTYQGKDKDATYRIEFSQCHEVLENEDLSGYFKEKHTRACKAGAYDQGIKDLEDKCVKCLEWEYRALCKALGPTKETPTKESYVSLLATGLDMQHKKADACETPAGFFSIGIRETPRDAPHFLGKLPTPVGAYGLTIVKKKRDACQQYFQPLAKAAGIEDLAGVRQAAADLRTASDEYKATFEQVATVMATGFDQVSIRKEGSDTEINDSVLDALCSAYALICEKDRPTEPVSLEAGAVIDCAAAIDKFRVA